MSFEISHRPWIGRKITFRDSGCRLIAVHVHGFGISCAVQEAGGDHAVAETVVSWPYWRRPPGARVRPNGVRPRFFRHVVAPLLARSGAAFLGPDRVDKPVAGHGVSNYSELVGDYTNPILQPWAADIVKKNGEHSTAGVVYATRPTSVGRNLGRSSTRISACRSFRSGTRSRFSTSRITKSVACA